MEAKIRRKRLSRVTPTHGRSHVIRVSDDVFKELQLRGHGLVDTPDSVLRRVLKIDTEDTKGTGYTLFDLLVQYFSTRGPRTKIMAEIRRRFYAFE